MTTHPTPNTAIEDTREQLKIDLRHSFWQFMTAPRDFSHTMTTCNMAADHLMLRVDSLLNTQAEERATARVKAFAEGLYKHIGDLQLERHGRPDREQFIQGQEHERKYFKAAIDTTLPKYTKGGA